MVDPGETGSQRKPLPQLDACGKQRVRREGQGLEESGGPVALPGALPWKPTLFGAPGEEAGWIRPLVLGLGPPRRDTLPGAAPVCSHSTELAEASTQGLGITGQVTLKHLPGLRCPGGPQLTRARQVCEAPGGPGTRAVHITSWT